MTDKTKLSVLIVGCGRIAGSFDEVNYQKNRPLTHAGAFTAHEGFFLSACVDPNTDRRLAFQHRWGIPQGYASIEEVERDSCNVDVISICSPSSVHDELLESALGLRPKLVFCEKPLTQSYQNAKKWVESYHAEGVLLAVNYTRRWDPDALKLKAELDRGEWGKVRSVVAIYNKGLFNNGTHMLDLVQMLFGDLHVDSAGYAVNDFSEGDPSIPSMLYSENGLVIQLQVADARDYFLFELQVVTELGVICMENGGMHWRVRHLKDSDNFAEYKNLDSGEIYPGRYPEALAFAADNIHKVLTSGEKLNSFGENAMKTLALCEHIRSISRVC